MLPHVELLTQVEAQYKLNNMLYNNAASMQYRKFGEVAYTLRLTDKMERLVNPDFGGENNTFEDVIRDAISYIFMFVGDLIANCKEPSDNRNVKETISQINAMSAVSASGIRNMSDAFEFSWLGDGASISEVPYNMYSCRDTSFMDYLNFAAYLITQYIERVSSEWK